MFPVDEPCFNLHGPTLWTEWCLDICKMTVRPSSPALVLSLAIHLPPPHAYNHRLWARTKENTAHMYTLAGSYITCYGWRRDTYLKPYVVLLCYHARVQLIVGSCPRLDPNLTVVQPCFCFRKRQERITCTSVGVPFFLQTLAIVTMTFPIVVFIFILFRFFFFFPRRVDCRLFTMRSVRQKSLPSHASFRSVYGRLIMPRNEIGWNLRVGLFWLTGVESSIVRLVSLLASALSPINHKGLHQYWTQTSLPLQAIHFTSHFTTFHVVVVFVVVVVVFSLFIFIGHSTQEPASNRVIYFIRRA